MSKPTKQSKGTMEQIKLGNRVKDIVSGFEGIAETRQEYLDGGVEYGIRPEADKKGSTYPSLQYVSEVYLQKVDDGIHVAPIERSIGFKAD